MLTIARNICILNPAVSSVVLPRQLACEVLWISRDKVKGEDHKKWSFTVYQNHVGCKKKGLCDIQSVERSYGERLYV